MQMPSIGRVVHFIAPEGAHLAAMVTEVADNHPLQAVCLFVMGVTGLSIQIDAPYSEDHQPGTWHWPEFVPQGAK